MYLLMLNLKNLSHMFLKQKDLGVRNKKMINEIKPNSFNFYVSLKNILKFF